MTLRTLLLALPVAAALALPAGARATHAQAPDRALPGVPRFEVDPFWPAPLPNNWILGQVAGVAVDANDHVWIVHRPRKLTEREAGAVQSPPLSQCCVPAPPVIEFDQAGNVVQAWGGDGPGFEWPNNEHSIFVDHESNVWIGGSTDDNQVLKFSRDGKFLLAIGEAGKTGGSNDTLHLDKPSGIHVDPVENEVYVTDGYGNRRVIVFDAKTGRYRRHWGAYGNRPDDTDPGPYDPKAPPAKQFRTPVHGVRVSRDGLVYVADRTNNRLQVFRRSGAFVREVVLAKETLAMGSVWDVAFSHDPAQTYLYIPDGTNQKVWILRRDDLRVVGEFGRGGRNAGYFGWVHSVAVDSSGDLYTGEVDIYKRLQKFRYVGAVSR